MKNSIETIWKEGFLNDDALVIPRLNNLYNLKSGTIIEKMMRMMRLNTIILVIFAFAFFTYSLFTETPLAVGIFTFLLIITPAIYSHQQMKKSVQIDHQSNCYNYLKSFNQWLQKQISRNIRLARFYYPACLWAAAFIMWFAEGREQLIENLLVKYPAMYMLGGIPVFFIAAFVIVSILMAVFAKNIYLWDVGLVYGRVFKKLNELISDLETLKKG
jgi:hypothetical protein